MHKRFVIIGLPGSGKSTFSAKLSKLLNIPVHHLDRHQFPNGKKLDKEEFLNIQRELVNEDSWIIEGCALSSLEIRYAKADTVLYFHLPRALCVWRIFKRLFHTPVGGEKIFNWELIKYIWTFDRDKRSGIEEYRKKYPHVDFHIFKSSKEAYEYFNKLNH